VHQAMRDACQIIEEEGGPVVIEAQCYRYLHQSGSKAGSDFGYRTGEEEEEWKRRDPIAQAERRLKELGIVSDAELAEIDVKVSAAVQAAGSRLTETAPGSNVLRIPDALWPSAESVDEGIL